MRLQKRSSTAGHRSSQPIQSHPRHISSRRSRAWWPTASLDCDYITVESEFSALSACLGASAAGSRTYSATTSQGLALMFEVCFNVAGMRLPIVMTIANRALGAPLSIWNDQQDSISLRDSGWLQFYAEDNQEATDLHYIAYKVAEDHRVLLPAFVCFDGFILSHTYEPVDVLTQAQADSYLPQFKPGTRNSMQMIP